MKPLNWLTKACGVCLLNVATAAVLAAQTGPVAPNSSTFTTLYSFFCSEADCADGAFPFAGLTQGADGSMYGTTQDGGTRGGGTAFSITTEGELKTLYNFCYQGNLECTGAGPDGYYLTAGLMQDTNEMFYGTTVQGGTNRSCEDGLGCGTLFSLTAGGTLKSLYNFCSQGGKDCTDGANPIAGLVRGTDRNFYGTTLGGGGAAGCGAIFRITPEGRESALYKFCSRRGAGVEPTAPLIEGVDRNYYGTTSRGAKRGGTVFSITPGGRLTTLYRFCSRPECADGYDPEGALVQGKDGTIYGTTSMGGGGSYGTDYGAGTVFSITPSRRLTTLHSFMGGKYGEGYYPVGGLVLGTDGNLYGVTEYGGANASCYQGCGTLFRITPKGELTTLYSFCSQPNCTDGFAPTGQLLQDTNGIFYGTTSAGGPSGGGADGDGTVFSLDMGLGPFVKTNPAAGEVGEEIGILGTDLTGASSVTFNGTAASFAVKSKTLIIATVPKGAVTGTVQVKLPGGTLSSNVPFYVLK